MHTAVDAATFLVDVDHAGQAVRATVQRARLAGVVKRRALQAALMHAALVLHIHLYRFVKLSADPAACSAGTLLAITSKDIEYSKMFRESLAHQLQATQV